MEALILYLLKLTIGLSFVILFYYLFLQKLTYYKWNRGFFLTGSFISFILPLVDVSPVVAIAAYYDITVLSGFPVFIQEQQVLFNVSWLTLIISVWLIGVAIRIVRLFLGLYSLSKLTKTAVLLAGNNLYKVYALKKDVAPFSFGRNIYLFPENYTRQQKEYILEHEMVHIRQRHTWDNLWGEFIQIVCWFNPFAMVLTRKMKENLEFIADGEVIDKGIDKKQYQYTLLNVMGNVPFPVTSNFNFYSLKKRIAMMNKKKSNIHSLSRFLLLVPAAGILLLSFRSADDLSAAYLPEIKKDIISIPFTSKDTLPIDTNKVKLKGNVSGLTIAARGEVDTTTLIKLRGVKTEAGKEPLTVLDGVPSKKGLDALNPADIESISILKDASATALYGDAGKNGVILITTKQGLKLKGEGTENLSWKVDDSYMGYYINGEKVAYEDMKKLNRDDILSVTVEKDAKKEGRNGTIKIVTK